MQLTLDAKYKVWLSKVTSAIGEGELPNVFKLFDEFFREFENPDEMEKIIDDVAICQGRYKRAAKEFSLGQIDYAEKDKTICQLQEGLQELKYRFKPFVEKYTPKKIDRPKSPPKPNDLDKGWDQNFTKTYTWNLAADFVDSKFEEFLGYWEIKSPKISTKNFQFDGDGNEVEIEVVKRFSWATGILISDEISIEKGEGVVEYFYVEALVEHEERSSDISIKVRGENGCQIMMDRITNWWKEIRKQNQ